MFALFGKLYAKFFDTKAERIIKRALACKTLSELITLQPIVILKYPKNSRRFAGRRMTVIEYLRRGTGLEMIAPRMGVSFYPVPTTDVREFPMYGVYVLVNDNWYDTQLLVAIEQGTSYPALVHKSEHFGIVEAPDDSYSPH